MARREEPLRAHLPRQSAGPRRAPGPQAQAQEERRPGAAAQLAAVHRVLRHGPAFQLEAAAAPRAAGANRNGLPDRLKSGVEALSGVSLDRVKVHYNSSRPAQLNALAYAQGSDIHLGPGQEKHLPHEAWHLVQQAQGRVRPTLQMKGGALVTDDAGLEHEADVMGARALTAGGRDARATAAGTAPAHLRPLSSASIAQAYSIKREPKLNTLHSVSDDQEVITGMGTPNHHLYVDTPAKIPAINDAAKQSVLEFSEGAKASLFGKPYSRVQAGFRAMKFTAPKASFFGSENRNVDLGETYHKHVAPALEAKSVEALKTIMGDIRGGGWEKVYEKIQAFLQVLTSSLELFKKLVIANQAKEGFRDDANLMEIPYGFIEALENSIYSKAAHQAGFGKAVAQLKGMSAAVLETDLNQDPHLVETLQELMFHTELLSELIPKDPPIDLMLIHSLTYQESMLRSISARDPMFYRACDVMAATLMGNKITKENQEQLKVYGAGGHSRAFHYAARILTAGPDWVSLESFAAGERETDILGLTEQNKDTNLDNSWQYMMYGSIKKDEPGGEQDNAFELYTKLRYYLKGIKAAGGFRTIQRDRLTGRIRKDSFTTISGVDAGKSQALWTRLFEGGVFNDVGRVNNPAYLEEDHVAPLLDVGDRAQAAAISGRLKVLYAQPSASQPYIQGVDNNEVRNVLAWIKLMKLPVDPQELEMALLNQLADVDPLKLHDQAWIEMLLAMERK